MNESIIPTTVLKLTRSTPVRVTRSAVRSGVVVEIIAAIPPETHRSALYTSRKLHTDRNPQKVVHKSPCRVGGVNLPIRARAMIPRQTIAMRKRRLNAVNGSNAPGSTQRRTAYHVVPQIRMQDTYAATTGGVSSKYSLLTVAEPTSPLDAGVVGGVSLERRAACLG